MTITRTQSYVRGTGTTSATATYGSATTAGNLLIARAKGTAATAGGTIPGWTAAVSVQYGPASGWITILYKIADGTETTATVTFASATATALEIEEWNNTDPFTGLDKTASTGTSNSTTKSTGTTATTTVNDELCIAFCAMAGVVTSPSWSNSFSTDFSEPSGAIVEVGGSKVVSTTGAQETTCTWTTSRYNAACIATFYGTASGWANIAEINGVAVANISEINGVAVANISEINGIAK